MPGTSVVTVPKLGIKAHFTNRHDMKRGHPIFRFCPYLHLPLALPRPALPIDWTKNNTIDFPMDHNDQYGCCMEAGADHADRTFIGNTGVGTSPSLAGLLAQYKKVSGGDNGLDEGMLVNQCWMPGLGGDTSANIVDALDIDPTDASLSQFAIANFFGILFMLSVPDAWINNFDTDYVWDQGSGVVANPNNGHGVWLNGVDENGNYKVQTWGTHGWITPGGVSVCEPSAFIVFSLRMFNAAGIARRQRCGRSPAARTCRPARSGRPRPSRSGHRRPSP
jgi:hypothetical protein